MTNDSFDPQYEKYINDIWTYKLLAEFSKINDLVFLHLHQNLKEPVFCIDWTMGRKWGEWNPTERTIRLNASLFRSYEWEAVIRVLKHEMGHQIVSEIFHFPGHGCSHGEHWKLACNAVGLTNPTRCDSDTFLAGLKGGEDSTVADKIRKLLCKGSDTTISVEESQLFLNKAQELMMRYQLTMKDLIGSERLWVKRPVGEYYERWPHWMWDIGAVLKEFYSVTHIRSHIYVPSKKKYCYYLEIFGEPSNVDIAEYVFYAILNNGRILYEQALKEHREKIKSDAMYRSYNSNSWSGRALKFTEASFMRGLCNGFKQKLYAKRDAIKDTLDESVQDNFTLVCSKNEKLLEEMYDQAYPTARKLTGVSYSGRSSGAGREASGKLSLSTAVRGGGFRGKMLA